MARQRPTPEVPPCYAMVLPGLETIAAEEITRNLKGDVKKTERGLVVFRPRELPDVLRLRTTEDVFLLGWGTDQLTYRAEDLEKIRKWTAKAVDWDYLLRLHHAIRPKPKGKPTYRLVAQMNGTHGYRRIDARNAMAEGLAGKFPASWKHAEENASIEVWLTIDGARGVCGVRLSDRSMRHRTYKMEHLPASLRPTVAAALVHLSETRKNMTVLDPMCGAGTILAEQLEAARSLTGRVELWGGDLDAGALRAAGVNLRRLGPMTLARWDAARLPLPDQSVDRILSNPPFGKQLLRPEDVGPLFGRVLPEYNRVLKPGGRAVLLVGDAEVLRRALREADLAWKSLRQFRVRVLGQPAALTVWRKPGEVVTMDPVVDTAGPSAPDSSS